MLPVGGTDRLTATFFDEYLFTFALQEFVVRNSHCIDGLVFFAFFRVYFLSVLFSAFFPTMICGSDFKLFSSYSLSSPTWSLDDDQEKVKRDATAV